MCGIVGIVRTHAPRGVPPNVIRRMAETLVHRGPDGEGCVVRPGCELGFRRLAIIDPAAPSQPYRNEDETIWSVCNGEIYNATELRADLQARGYRFRTEVDTEVLPFLYQEYGPALTSHLDGMFAFAIWDERTRTLVLGRDRAGEKPLFYCETGGDFVFASELRALQTHPDVPRALDPVGLRRYLLHGYYPAPSTPFHGVRKLPAAHTLVLRRGNVEVERYWDLADSYAQPRVEGSLDQLAAEVDRLISEAIRRRRRSDVPVGVFLSGGIDSTTVLAHVTEQLGPGVPAFGLGHVDPSFDESRFARQTARHYGADYHEIILSQSDLDDGLRRVTAGFDEPLGDASIIPTYLLSVMARRQVKVILSGEGADELFAGYPTYIGNRFAQIFLALPRPARALLERAVRLLGPARMGNVSIDYLLKRFMKSAALDPIERHHTWFGCFSPAAQERILAPDIQAALGQDDPFAAARDCVRGKTFPDGLSELLYCDFSMYLQDDLLTKVDRASMLTSLEVRAPFLDHELAEFVARLPTSAKLRGKSTKRVLRRAGRKRLPKDVLARRKRGFNIPFSRWLSDGLGERLLERFSEARLERRGVFHPQGLTGMIRQHLAREADHGKALFAALVFDLWCDRVYGKGMPVEIAAAPSPVSRSVTGAA